MSLLIPCDTAASWRIKGAALEAVADVLELLLHLGGRPVEVVGDLALNLRRREHILLTEVAINDALTV